MNEQRFQAYLEHRKMLAASRQSAFDAFDRAVLTLSSAMLALSMSFIRDIAKGLILQEVLYFSWLSFFCAIVCTLMSFVESQRSMDLQEQIANDYYVREDDSALTRENPHSDRIKRMNIVSGCAFCFGFLLAMLFVKANLDANHL